MFTPDDFLARLHDAHLLQNDFGPPRSVKLHRQRDQLEHQQDQVAINAERDQPGHMENETAENDERQHLRGDRCHWHDRHARFQRRVGFGMLDGVAGFVRGNAKRRHRRRIVDVASKGKAVCCVGS